MCGGALCLGLGDPENILCSTANVVLSGDGFGQEAGKTNDGISENVCREHQLG